MIQFYRQWLMAKPGLSLVIVMLLCALALSQVPKTRLDASSDSLLLQGDPDLEFYRETSKHYDANDFLVLTWRPTVPLLSDDSLEPLAVMAQALEQIDGVLSVTTLLDVPLLESPPLGLTALSDADSMPTLRDPSVDRDLALRELTNSPIYRNLVVSEFGDLTAVQVTLAPNDQVSALLDEREALRSLAKTTGLNQAEQQRLLDVTVAYDVANGQQAEAHSQLVAEVRDVAERFRPYAEIFVGGVPMIAADMIAFIQSDLVTFGGAIVFIMMLVLGLIFRDWRWVLAPIVNCVVTATLMLGLLAFLDWRMTVISSNFVAVLLIITLSLSIHLIVRYRELEHSDPDISRRERALMAAQLMLLPCFYTALTTVVAFASLVVAGIQPVIDFGWMMTVGIVVGFIMTFVIVPSLMMVLPGGTRAKSDHHEDSMTRHFATIVERFGGQVLLVSGLILLATIAGISQLKVENRFIDYFKESTEIYRGMELLDARLGGTVPLDIVLSPPQNTVPSDATPTLDEDAFDAPSEQVIAEDEPFDDLFSDDPFGDDISFASEDTTKPSYWFSPAGRAVLDRAHHVVEAQPESGKVLSLSSTFKVLDAIFGAKLGGVEMALVQNSLPEDVSSVLIDPYFAADIDQARITVRAMETSKDLRRDEYLKRLRQQLLDETGLAPEQVQFTGLLVLYNNVLQSLFASQILTLGAVFLAIGLMFWGLFRSLSWALLALAPNILAAGMVLGIMGLLGIPLDIMTITIAAIVVGIGVDDCIHYIHRFRQEFSVDDDYHAAMHRSHASIGRAMYYTTLTIMVGFSLLTLSNFTPSLYFGLLTVSAMAAAVAGALLLLPKLILIFKPLGPGRSA